MFTALLAPTRASSQPVEEHLPDAQQDGFDAVVNWSEQRLLQAQLAYEQLPATRMASPEDWSGQVVYNILIDRFANGDPNNDSYQLEPLPLVPEMRHGGDLAGILTRLDYLQDLGITTIWLSPVVQHDGSYHGYCPTDPTQVDRGFGDNALLQQLVAAAHERGMYVLLDVVLNHLCDRETTYVRPAKHELCITERQAQFDLGRIRQTTAQGALQFGPSFFPPLRHPAFFHRCGPNSWDETSSEQPASLYGDFVPSMLDIHNSHPVAQKVLSNLYMWWIAYADIDGFRVDAAKHMGEDFIAYFATHARHYAKQLGKENFFVVGEVAGSAALSEARLGNMIPARQLAGEADKQPIAVSITSMLSQLEKRYNTHPRAPYPGLNAVFDFANSGIARRVLRLEEQPNALYQHQQSDTDKKLRRASFEANWQQLESHDWPRFASNKFGSERTSALAMAYLALTSGVPVVYYGMEQAMNGDCHWYTMNVGAATSKIQQLCQRAAEHVLARQDMFTSGPWLLGSMVPAIDSLAAIGPASPPNLVPWQQDAMLDRSHVVYQTARRWLTLRKQAAVLQKGQIVFHQQADDAHPELLIFSRLYGSQEIVVVLNLSEQAQAIPTIRLQRLFNPWDRDIRSRPGRPPAKQPYPMGPTLPVYVNMTDPNQQLTAVIGRMGPDDLRPPPKDRPGLPPQAYPPLLERMRPYLEFRDITAPPQSVTVFATEAALGPWQDELGRLAYTGPSY